MSFTLLFFIGLAGFFGAIARYLIAGSIARWLGLAFPIGTLAVNCLGSLCMGFLSRFLLEHMIVNEVIRIAVLVGFLGAFTTFSTFSYETVSLIQQGDLYNAALNIIGSTVLCILFCLVGLQLAKVL